MNLVRPFEQSSLMPIYEQKTEEKIPVKGICFRVTYKWAACQLLGGEFKYDALNIVKTVNKQAAYRQKTKDYSDANADLKDAGVLRGFVDLDTQEVVSFINEWGMTVKDAQKTLYQSLVVSEQVREKPWDYMRKGEGWRKETLIIGYYGPSFGTGEAMGHAVALHGPGPVFFDANFGMYEFGTSDPAAEVEGHVTGYLLAFRPTHFVITKLGKRA
jgi:hypothetical protein